MRVSGQHHNQAFLPQGKRHDSHCTGGWVRRKPDVDGYEKSRPHPDPIPGPSSP